MPLDEAKIKRLRAVLNPRRERYDFGRTMNRWASEVRAYGDGNSEPLLIAEHEIDWGAELLADVLEPGPAPRRSKQREAGDPGGRPRNDKERFAALMLGVIYQEYTGKPPKRITKANGAEPPFFRFASEAFKAIGLYPRVQAFREVGERWGGSRDFLKGAMETLLWGGLPGFKRRKAPN
jgi:hypothetical protein